MTSRKLVIITSRGDIEKSLAKKKKKAGEFTSITGIMRNFFKHAPFSFDRLWQFRGQIGMFENLKMAAPLVAILAPESSYYLVVIYIELPFHSLCKQFIIITVVFIGLLVQKAKFLLYHGNQRHNPFNLLQTMQSSKPVLKT